MTTGMGWRSIALVVALTASGCSDSDNGGAAAGSEERTTRTAVHPAPAPEFSDGTCPPPIPDVETIRCGTVSVELRRDQTNSPRIDIAVAVLRAPEPGRHDDPLVVINAFEASFAGFDGFAALPEAIERDVVFFDMRGLGRSTPSLMCSEVDYLVRTADTDPTVRQQYLDALDRCRQRLESEGVDLRAYTVDAIADDVVDIRRALGYDTWNVIGYGQIGPDPGPTSSEIVYELMRHDGGAIRSVTIGGADGSATGSLVDPDRDTRTGPIRDRRQVRRAAHLRGGAPERS